MGWRLKFNEKEKAEIVLVQGKPFLYYCYKLDHDTVPKNLFVYEVADDGSNGCFCRIAKYILVNHWGTLVGKYELDLNEDGRYYPEEDSDEYYMDIVNYMNAEDYLEIPDEAIMDGAQMVFKEVTMGNKLDNGYDADILQKLASKLIIAKDKYDGDTSSLTDSYVELVNAIYDLTDYIEDGVLPDEEF